MQESFVTLFAKCHMMILKALKGGKTECAEITSLAITAAAGSLSYWLSSSAAAATTVLTTMVAAAANRT